jgi:hypothetical protein
MPLFCKAMALYICIIKITMMENNFKGPNWQEGRIVAGLILVLVGGALLMRNTGFPLPGWLFSWPSVLILVGLYIGIKSKFANSTSIILMGMGGFFLADRFIPGLRLTPYFWPAIIIAVGIMFILLPRRTRNLRSRRRERNTLTEPGLSNNWQQTENAFSTAIDGNDLLKITSVFSGIKRNIVSKNFRGGKISCVFGGAEIDLTQADIQGNAEIRFEVIFGGVELVVPAHWKVFNEIDGVFHGVDDERRYNASIGTQPEKILTLKGSVIFGGVEIKSYG